jgi:nucleotide-binding universal stress UspA family protein
MIEKVLVAVDGSAHSLKAVEYAAEIASACKAKLLILTVLKPQKLPKMSEELRKYAQLEHIDDADYEAIKLLSSDLLETGPVARTIVNVGVKKKASMIVIGSRGLGNIEATLRGGVSHRVELLARCPVLTVQ